MKEHFDNLYLFTQIVYHGGIKAAADANQLQRSLVSRRLQDLESYIGEPLLIRSTRSCELTAMGRRLFDSVEPSVRNLSNTLVEIVDEKGSDKKTLRIAIPTALMTSPPIKKAFTKYTQQFPNVSLEIENHQDSVDMIKGMFDLQIISDSTRVPDNSYVQFSLMKYKWHFVASSEYAEKCETIDSMETLAQHKLLMNAYDSNYFDTSGLNVFQSDDLHLIGHMAESSCGIALLPIPFTLARQFQIDLVEIPCTMDFPFPIRSMNLRYPSTVYQSDHVKALIEILRVEFGKISAK